MKNSTKLNYYYETKTGQGWRKAETDAAAKRQFAHWGGVKVWRQNDDGTLVLILDRKRKG